MHSGCEYKEIGFQLFIYYIFKIICTYIIRAQNEYTLFGVGSNSLLAAMGSSLLSSLYASVEVKDIKETEGSYFSSEMHWKHSLVCFFAW